MILRTLRDKLRRLFSKAAVTAQKVNDPESCAAMMHLSAHPHICPASIISMTCAAFFFIFKLFRKN